MLKSHFFLLFLNIAVIKSVVKLFYTDRKDSFAGPFIIQKTLYRFISFSAVVMSLTSPFDLFIYFNHYAFDSYIFFISIWRLLL